MASKYLQSFRRSKSDTVKKSSGLSYTNNINNRPNNSSSSSSSSSNSNNNSSNNRSGEKGSPPPSPPAIYTNYSLPMYSSGSTDSPHSFDTINSTSPHNHNHSIPTAANINSSSIISNRHSKHSISTTGSTCQQRTQRSNGSSGAGYGVGSTTKNNNNSTNVNGSLSCTNGNGKTSNGSSGWVNNKNDNLSSRHRCNSGAKNGINSDHHSDHHHSVMNGHGFMNHSMSINNNSSVSNANGHHHCHLNGKTNNYTYNTPATSHSNNSNSNNNTPSNNSNNSNGHHHTNIHNYDSDCDSPKLKKSKRRKANWIRLLLSKLSNTYCPTTGTTTSNINSISHNHNWSNKTTCVVKFTPSLIFCWILTAFLLISTLTTLLFVLNEYDQQYDQNQFVHPLEKDPSIDYKVLCTSHKEQMKWGSFLIRCRDLKTWVNKCAPKVQIDLFSHSTIKKQDETFRSKLKKAKRQNFVKQLFQSILPSSIFNTNQKLTPLSQYDATMTIKRLLPTLPYQSRYGKMYIDIVDDYKTQEESIPKDMQVIVQNQLHGLDKFPNRTFHVVEHWYNSYPADMFSVQPVFDVPSIRTSVGYDSTDPIKFVTVWTNKKEPCPSLSLTQLYNTAIEYTCIDETYQIEEWYPKYFNVNDTSTTIASSAVSTSTSTSNANANGRRNTKNTNQLNQYISKTLKNTQLGSGRIYYELFWMYDVLVIPAKHALKPKLRYGNVQRAVSQMRSGVPVLLEVYGEVLEEFMDLYDYSCVYYNYTRISSSSSSSSSSSAAASSQSSSSLTLLSSKYWTFDEAIEQMRNADVRRKCQEEGLKIALDYSPNRIAQKHLRALGYEGEFTCASR